MNFLDPYDVANPATATPPEQAQPQPSLEEEVNQVIGQLGGFWGMIRKQGQTALQTARKDFSEVVVQAQKEVGKWTAPEPSAGEAASPSNTTDASSGRAVEDKAEGSSSSSTPEVPSSDSTTSQALPSSSSQTLFSRFQAALPPNIASTLQNNIPESIRHASESVDFAQLRTTLSDEFQRVQGVTRSQAEDYVKKSEAMLREAMKEAGAVLKDAVKIIPPEEGNVSSSSSTGFIWDGSDMWMLPSEASDSSISSRGKSSEVGTPSSGSLGDLQRVATRADSLLKRLRHDAEIIKHEPSPLQFNTWLEKEVDVKEGGIDSDHWKARMAEEWGDPADGAALQATHDELVPSVLDDATFWKRYFFRIYQIRHEEEKRKALIQSVEQEEDFSWEDDDDETPSTSDRKPVAASTEEAVELPAASSGKGHVKDSSRDTNISSPQLLTPAGTSPRASEDGSYDVVPSSRASNASTKDKEDSDGDSDWE
ncbi:BSD domain-containing protein [Pleurotus pulmonarius]